MKLTLFLSILTISQLWATETYSQFTKLTLKLEDVKISEALKEIENQSEFYFLYSPKLIDVERKVSITADKETIKDILTDIFGKSVNIALYDRQIILTSKDQPEVLSIVQQQKITGKVTDKSGAPLPGVSIVVKGTTTGTMTGIDGSFTLAVPPDGKILVFSFVGMTSKEVIIGDKSIINITLEELSQALEEVVVIGYGVQKKSNVTGSISTVSLAKIKDFPIQSVQQTLAGQVSGVQVIQGTGAPGAPLNIRVRGVGSISAGTQPLYVIDGFIGVQDLNSININDIQSIEVLKDASAAAIYGSRGSNGVVLVTTKKGSEGKLKTEFNFYSGFQEVSKKIDVLNAHEWVELCKEAKDNAWIDNGGSLTTPVSSRPATYRYPDEYANPESFGEGTDFQDLIFQIAPISNYDLSLSGGGDRSRFFISGNFFNQLGIIKNSGFKKYSLRASNEVNITKNIKIGINLTPTFSIQDWIQAEGHWESNSIIACALNIPPIVPAYNEDGSYGTMIPNTFAMPNIPNPLVALYEMGDKRSTLNLLGISFVEINIIKGLRFKSAFSAYLINFNRETYSTSKRERDGLPIPQPPDASYSTSKLLNLLNENTLSYSTTFGNDHSLDMLLGFTVQKENFENSYVFATNFPNDLVRTINAGKVTDGSSEKYEWSLLSYIGRLNYAYKEKYLLSATIRRDGSSRFGMNNKWGIFPSYSFGWRISKERFMESLKFISNLKFRGSYGNTGNNTIPNYGSIGLAGFDNYTFGNQIAYGIAPITISNQDLTWEKTKQLNFGFDLGFFKDRISFEVDFFDSRTTDLLLNVPTPSLTGFSNALQNIGRMQNTGWELGITTRNLVSVFSWSTSLNFSTNRNKILALGPNGDPIYGENTITKIGSPIGSYFGYMYEGIFNTQEEINSRPHSSFDAPGNSIVRDANNDGQISPDDRVILGDNFPDLFFGASNSFTYKNFDLNILIQGVNGSLVMSRTSHLYRYEGRFNVYAAALNRWKSAEKPGDGNIPRADFVATGNRGPSPIFDADYLRITNLTFGYRLPKTVLKFNVPSTRMYFSVQNLWTITQYQGYNPEVNYSGPRVNKSGYLSVTNYTVDPLNPGGDFGGYPLPRTYTIGINMSF